MVKKRSVIAVAGAYRKGGVIDSAVEETLATAREQVAEVSGIYPAHADIGVRARRKTRRPGQEAAGRSRPAGAFPGHALRAVRYGVCHGRQERRKENGQA